jgi:hypothetical protein
MKKLIALSLTIFLLVVMIPTKKDVIVENDKKYFKMISALTSAGCPVDGTRFSENMKNRKFVENVRTRLKMYGYVVPDSSDFFEKYFNKGN